MWGYILRDKEEIKPTRASIFLFGSPASIHQMLPRPTLDIQWITVNKDDPIPKTRWIDRFVSEDNLITTWIELVSRYIKKAAKPFRIDPHTLLRNDAHPEYRVFREAAINLLIHQDYGDHSRKGVIKFFQDCIQFWNPGDIFGATTDILKPGEKDVRNPRIVTAFRRLGLCEQAGTGMIMVLKEWQALGYTKPCFENDRFRHAFELILPEIAKKSIQTYTHTEQTSEQVGEQVIKILHFCKSFKSKKDILEHIGLSFTYLNYKRHIFPLIDNKYIELTIPDKPQSRLQKYKTTCKGLKFLNKQVSEQVNKQVSEQVSEQVNKQVSEQVNKQVGEQVNKQADEQFIKILQFCKSFKSKKDILKHIGLSFTYFNYKRHIFPLIDNKYIELKIPHKPQSRLQKYKTTHNGLIFLNKHFSEQVSEQVIKILQFCNKSFKSKKDILKHIGLSSIYLNYKRHILPLVNNKYIELTIPDKPQSQLQKYKTTHNSLKFLNKHVSERSQ